MLHHGNRPNYSPLDNKISELLAKCLAWDKSDRMSLQDTLKIGENAVTDKNSRSIPRQFERN
ncbi:uncharacterized protein F4812DRAFT_430071 [Daldinia caldariorum]|uniref:uncharacterized protein n=1 Tax=Daldinia caldariorum TaxID=326644 RepID=UPI00200810F9|nr:uncharacterized protein F4812DRAFT_430071 [Daldinia caldariorum]KAI1467580.1 hypothetical protein F4812DRAFT_430071 [Daldinia caldariorum]